MMIKKCATLLLAILLTGSLLASCDDTDVDVSSPSEVSSAVSAGITANICGTELGIDSVNTGEGNVKLYNRDYKKDTYVFTVAVEKDSVCIVAKLDSEDEYSISKVVKKEGTIIPIPVNGFVMTLPNEEFEKIDPPKFGSLNGVAIQMSDYSSPEFEPLNLASAMPEDKANSRRINMLYPENGELEEGKIYLCSDKDSYTVPVNSTALIVKKGTRSYTVEKYADSGEAISGTYSLLFCGEYNSQYCKNFFGINTTFTIARENLLNNVTDLPAVSIDGKIYALDGKRYNATTISDGINVFTNDYGRLVTPFFDGDFICAVVTDEKVVYISDICERIIIPSGDSYAMVFCGNALEDGKKLKIGDKISSVLISSSRKPEAYVMIDGKIFEFDGSNVELSAKKSVLYSALYGDSTNTPESTLEIVFSDGEVLSVSTKGNSTIPVGGYVMSIDKDNRAYEKALEITAGAKASLASQQYQYSTIVLNYTHMNGVRYTDELIIYDGTEGKTTGTNVYGYEITVDANGIACSGSTSGNSTVPENGFVVSGHGVNSTALQELYQLGMHVSYDKFKKTVTFVKSPSLKIVETAAKLSDLSELLSTARSNYYAINYEYIDKKIEAANALYAKAEEDYKKGNIDSAIAISDDISTLLSSLDFYLYESSSVENRSTWYRSSEKNDDEVRATVEKMAALGINAVYIETWYDGRTIGYSDDERIQHHSEVHGDYDVLEGFCRIAHEYGIEVHAWCENFFIGTSGGYLVELMKDKRCIDRNGLDRYPNGYGEFIFLNPNDRECRDLVLGVYKELVTKYDLDGIHLDYIRFSEPNPDDGDFGYNDDIIAGFQKEYNTDIDPHTIKSDHSMWKDWCKYRENIINSFVGEVYDAVKAIDEDIYLSAACYPNFYTMGEWNFQNFRDWVDKGYIDEIFSMSYGADLSYPLSNAKDFIKAINGRCFYSIGVSAFEQTAASILVEQIFYSKQAGASGSNPFSWGSLVGHPQNYYDALKAGVYSRKAVKLNKGSVTVAAGMNDLLDNIKNTYSSLKPDCKDYYDKLTKAANEILAKAEAFDYEKASSSEKLAYCQSTLTELNELIKTASETDDKALADAVKRCVVPTVNAMKISIARMTVK